MSDLEQASFVDSTLRFEWKLSKEEFDQCEDGDCIQSPTYNVKIGTDSSTWYINLYPKEDNGKQVEMYLNLESGDKVYKVLFGFGVKTDDGYWPNGDLVKKLYSHRRVNEEIQEYYYEFDLEKDDWPNWGDRLCTTEEFIGHFRLNEVTLVTTLVFYMEGENYRNMEEVANDFIEDVRSTPLQEHLSDITVISGEKKFPGHKVLMAMRSKYFDALFRHEPHKTEVRIEEASPEIVEVMLDFMSTGLIPSDIDVRAVDLIALADMYRVELLSKVCLDSIVNILSPANALEALIIVDKLEHVSKSDHKDKILAYIKKEAAQIVKDEKWDEFAENYPRLMTKMFLSACNAKI